MTPKMLTMTEVKTPSQVPKRTGSLRKKLEAHQGFSPSSPWPSPFFLKRAAQLEVDLLELLLLV